MSQVVARKAYIFHTDLGMVVTEFKRVERFDVEDIIQYRAVAQARKIQLVNQGKKVSPNDPSAARTMESVYSQTGEELPE